EPLDGPLQEVQSNMDGRFTFVDVPAGRYWLDYALKPGGTGGDGVVVADAGTYKEVHWPLSPGGQMWDLSVVVTDSDRTALAGTDVTFRRFSGAVDGPSCETARALTDAQGRSHVSELPSGTYRVVVAAKGFVPQTRDVTVGPARARTLTVRLHTPA